MKVKVFRADSDWALEWQINHWLESEVEASILVSSVCAFELPSGKGLYLLFYEKGDGSEKGNMG